MDPQLLPPRPVADLDEYLATDDGGIGLARAVELGPEGEPSTFKDRALLRANPYQMLEGLLIAAFAIGAESVYVALKERFARERDRVTTAAADMQAAGICSDCEIISRAEAARPRRWRGDLRRG